MAFNDVREFIDKLEQEGELVRMTDEVDWNLEAGAILRASHEKRLPAPYFEKIKDYPSNYKMAGGILANHRRVAIAMDMDPDTPPSELQEEYLKRSRNPIKPVVVKSGPCKENIILGKDVDLTKFPAPIIHGGDGGRFFATFHLNISSEVQPDGTTWTNYGMHRGMMFDEKRLGVTADPPTHFGGMLTRCEERGETMKTAIAIGPEPTCLICSASPIPFGVSEVDVAGGLRRKPVELVKCETSDILVPATSEIVLEGEMRPHEREVDGPFGEFTGYGVAGQLPRPVMRVTAITHRNNPVFTYSNEGMPLADSHSIVSITKAAECLKALRNFGIDVKAVNVPPECALQLTIVSVKTTYANVATDIANIIWSVRASRSMYYLIVVDENVDPFDLPMVLHALSSKCHPGKGIFQIKKAPIISYTPYADSHERLHRSGARAYFDCTWPKDWLAEEVPIRTSLAETYPEDMQKKALDRWKKYGF